MNWNPLKALMPPKEATEHQKKIERAAEDFAVRFERVMEDLARG